MANKNKKTVYSTQDLIALRQKYYRRSVWAGIGIALLVIVLYVVWIVMAILINGYGSIEPTIGTKGSFPYFNTDKALSFDLLDHDIAYRWITGLCVLIVAVVLGIIVYKATYKKNDKKAQEVQSRSLKAMVKEEIGLDSILIKTTDTSNDESLYKQIAIENVKKDYLITVASDVMSYDIQQVEYEENGVKKNGAIFVTSLSNAKSVGYIQFRSYGSLPYVQHNGKNIGIYALSSTPSDSPFVVYTDLKSNEIGRLVESDMVEQISKLHAMTKSGTLVTTNGNTLSIFLDNTQLNFTTKLKEKIDDRLLETQCEAINAVYETLLTITKSFSDLPDAPMVKERIGERSNINSAEFLKGNEA